ncbi:hypothetical protein J2T13_003041 [Paenibacillus sp. DS2015]|uniref:hypothetical protein n=1 Tax=Paenibacillus sp. DS2015 TaxID=3373917 RepID=UPI003D20648C
MKATPPAPSEEDALLVKNYLLHMIMLDVLERDIQSMVTLSLKMQPLYIRGLSGIQKQVMSHLSTLRLHMGARGIRIYQESRTNSSVETLYLCRGYHRRLFMPLSYIKSEVTLKLNIYLGATSTLPNSRIEY